MRIYADKWYGQAKEDLYAYAKQWKGAFGEYVDVDMKHYGRIVESGLKVELWFVETKKHCNAILLNSKNGNSKTYSTEKIETPILEAPNVEQGAEVIKGTESKNVLTALKFAMQDSKVALELVDIRKKPSKLQNLFGNPGSHSYDFRNHSTLQQNLKTHADAFVNNSFSSLTHHKSGYAHKNRDASCQDSKTHRINVPADIEEEPKPQPALLASNFQCKVFGEDAKTKAKTIVLLGETGVGKSTFVNSILSYLEHQSLAEAERSTEDLKCLIPSKFLYNQQMIMVGKESADESLDKPGESATQRPKTYEFKVEGQLYRIIDVPGIGDSRGIDQDRKNFDLILDEINKQAEINAFCILMASDNPRITVAMRYCIYELLSNLHKGAAKNILFCFTKARTTFYKPGESYNILRKYLDDLSQQQGVKIPLDDSSSAFYFDNEPFKYLCLKQNGICLDGQRKQYDRSFEVSRESTLRLFHRVQTLLPHDTREMAALTDTRRLILHMVPISAETTKKIQMNKKMLEDQMEKLAASKKIGKSLQEHLYINEYRIKTTPLKKPRTVCASSSCISKVPIADSVRYNILYKKICHDPCHLMDVKPGQYPNEALKSCATFNDEKVCKKCQCKWDVHIHLTYLQEVRTTIVPNKQLQEAIKEKNIQNLTIEDVLKSYRSRLEDLQRDEEFIKKMCAKFSTFLRSNSMSIRNDVYLDYLKHAVKLADQELSFGGSYHKAVELQKSLKDYEEEVRLLQAAEYDGSVVTIDDINALKVQLRELANRHAEIKDLLCIAEKNDVNGAK
ncbi:hypothetical protein L596_013947 [Steinernema carpocapsae]|nr:hypothetical protein L596_013947 [Steinernema carpocapsae]